LGFKALPWLLLLPVAVDTFFDGVLLALAYVASPNAGFILAVAFAFETSILGGMTSITLRHKGFPPLIPIIISICFALLFFIGGIIGASIFSQASGALFLAFLSFGVGALSYLVIDDLLIEAREKNQLLTGLQNHNFILGFLLCLFCMLHWSEVVNVGEIK